MSLAALRDSSNIAFARDEQAALDEFQSRLRLIQAKKEPASGRDEGFGSETLRSTRQPKNDDNSATIAAAAAVAAASKENEQPRPGRFLHLSPRQVYQVSATLVSEEEDLQETRGLSTAGTTAAAVTVAASGPAGGPTQRFLIRSKAPASPPALHPLSSPMPRAMSVERYVSPPLSPVRRSLDPQQEIEQLKAQLAAVREESQRQQWQYLGQLKENEARFADRNRMGGIETVQLSTSRAAVGGSSQRSVAFADRPVFDRPTSNTLQVSPRAKSPPRIRLRDAAVVPPPPPVPPLASFAGRGVSPMDSGIATGVLGGGAFGEEREEARRKRRGSKKRRLSEIVDTESEEFRQLVEKHAARLQQTAAFSGRFLTLVKTGPDLVPQQPSPYPGGDDERPRFDDTQYMPTPVFPSSPGRALKTRPRTGILVRRPSNKPPRRRAASKSAKRRSSKKLFKSTRPVSSFASPARVKRYNMAAASPRKPPDRTTFARRQHLSQKKGKASRKRSQRPKRSVSHKDDEIYDVPEPASSPRVVSKAQVRMHVDGFPKRSDIWVGTQRGSMKELGKASKKQGAAKGSTKAAHFR